MSKKYIIDSTLNAFFLGYHLKRRKQFISVRFKGKFKEIIRLIFLNYFI